MLYMLITLQWNPVNTATNGPPKIGRINGVAVLTRKGHILEFKGEKINNGILRNFSLK